MVLNCQYNPEHEYDFSPAFRPYVLWFETLPSGDTAKVFLCPHPTCCDVVAHWNGQAKRAETCASVAEAAGAPQSFLGHLIAREFS